jgi:hypothetical protein
MKENTAQGSRQPLRTLATCVLCKEDVTNRRTACRAVGKEADITERDVSVYTYLGVRGSGPMNQGEVLASESP